MDRIANTRELRAELERIIRLASEANPSRAQFANELRTLASKLAGEGDTPQSAAAAVKWIERLEAFARAAKQELTAKKGEGTRDLADLVGYINGMRDQAWWEHFFH
jgi:hypothetical protein